MGAAAKFDHARDKEIRAFCELLRLVWTEDPDYSFGELIDFVGFYQGGIDVLLEAEDVDNFKAIQTLYQADSGLRETINPGVEIGEFVPEVTV